ncbi:MAG: hypothetical protein NT154_03325 [Verrucomicrobia bacterium]|nr:hypothetical protein [Verrucomicrobiota bacterium]
MAFRPGTLLNDSGVGPGGKMSPFTAGKMPTATLKRVRKRVAGILECRRCAGVQAGDNNWRGNEGGDVHAGPGET